MNGVQTSFNLQQKSWGKMCDFQQNGGGEGGKQQFLKSGGQLPLISIGCGTPVVCGINNPPQHSHHSYFRVLRV